MQQIKKTLLSVALFLSFTALACFFALNSWNGVIYIYVGDARTPAAVQKRFDVSNLKGSDLRIASRDRLLSDAHLLFKSGMTGIELGHFITKNQDGVRQFACQMYQRVQLVFQAEGMAESGEIPTMNIEGPCLMSSADINHMSPIWIPYKNFLAQRPHDFAVDYEEDDERLTFSFRNMGSEWPDTWALHKITLIETDQTTNGLEFSSQEIRSIRPMNLTMHWTRND
jgi:hypothetical protein